jgi:uncharacterized protein
MNDNPEVRTFALADAEVRVETTEAGKPIMRGIALRYGSLSVPLRDSKNREFREKFAPGAFSRALATGADVRALINHDKNLILGRNVSGTLRLFDEPDALRFEIDPPDTELSRHYIEAVRRGDLSGMSFRFYKIADRWEGAGGVTIREVISADLDDISIVAYPAYPDTEVATRSLDEYHRSQSRWDQRRASVMVRLRLAEAESPVIRIHRRRPSRGQLS